MHSTCQLDRNVLDRRCTRPVNSTGQLDRSSWPAEYMWDELAGRAHVGRVGRSSTPSVECVSVEYIVGQVSVEYISVELAGRVHCGRVGRSSASRSNWPVECIAVELAGRVHRWSSWPLSILDPASHESSGEHLWPIFEFFLDKKLQCQGVRAHFPRRV